MQKPTSADGGHVSQQLFRPREVAKITGLSLSFVKKLCAEGRIHCVRVNTAVRVPRAEVERIVAHGIPLIGAA